MFFANNPQQSVFTNDPRQRQNQIFFPGLVGDDPMDGIAHRELPLHHIWTHNNPSGDELILSSNTQFVVILKVSFIVYALTFLVTGEKESKPCPDISLHLPLDVRINYLQLFNWSIL